MERAHQEAFVSLRDAAFAAKVRLMDLLGYDLVWECREHGEGDGLPGRRA